VPFECENKLANVYMSMTSRENDHQIDVLLQNLDVWQNGRWFYSHAKEKTILKMFVINLVMLM
jgi:uncharacterized membrane protein